MATTKLSLFLTNNRPKAKIFAFDEFIAIMKFFGLYAFLSPRMNAEDLGKSEAEQRGFTFPEESQQEDLLVVGTPDKYIAFSGGGVEVFYEENVSRNGVLFFAGLDHIKYKKEAGSLIKRIINILTEGKEEIFCPFLNDHLISFPSTKLFLSEIKEIVSG